MAVPVVNNLTITPNNCEMLIFAELLLLRRVFSDDCQQLVMLIVVNFCLEQC